ncbi:hypothetical protein M0R45_028197 [Rubus argutus]|uniref:Uncharacterized protein n=1 Tax=Rubus argutus TaxID=59490 RepID=A0AAW1W6K0_RUBAR
MADANGNAMEANGEFLHHCYCPSLQFCSFSMMGMIGSCCSSSLMSWWKQKDGTISVASAFAAHQEAVQDRDHKFLTQSSSRSL